jgi:metal-responsive CopG/Arc/MetJ family transcriptional regulator
MPTSVHLPKPLLAAVDRRARALKMSRNRLIVQLLERELAANSEWSPEFFAALSTPGPEVKAGVQE